MSKASDDVYLRIARACQRVESGQCIVFISLADADAMMANPPPKMNAIGVLRAIDWNFAQLGNALRCCGHPVRLDRQLAPGVIEIVIGDAYERLKEIGSRRSLPDGSGA